MDELLEVETK